MSLLESEHEINDPQMPLTAHLEELRRRLFWAGAAIMIAFVIAWGFSDRVLNFVQAPVLKYVEHLQFDTLTDPFFTHLKAAFFAAVFFTFPVTLSQIWLFVAPGLYKREKLLLIPFLALSYPLFIGGGLFGYLVVFPYAFEFLINFDQNLVPSLRVGDYLSFTIRLLFVFGLVFELPLISLLLTRMGMVNHKQLSKFRRYAIVIIFISAAVLTPPDIVTQALLAAPLIVLYEISIIVSWAAKRRKEKERAADEE